MGGGKGGGVTSGQGIIKLVLLGGENDTFCLHLCTILKMTSLTLTHSFVTFDLHS